MDVKEVVDNILRMAEVLGQTAPQDYLDTAYGANRALNGVSLGSLDYLGQKV